MPVSSVFLEPCRSQRGAKHAEHARWAPRNTGYVNGTGGSNVNGSINGTAYVNRTGGTNVSGYINAEWWQQCDGFREFHHAVDAAIFSQHRLNA